MSVIYSNFVTNRRKEYQLQTKIIEENGKKFVRKIAYSADSKKHIARIAQNCERLKQAVSNGTEVCGCSCTDDYIDFEFVEGKTLADCVYDAYNSGGFDAAAEKFDEYNHFLHTCCKEYKPYEYSVEAKNILGVTEVGERECMYPANIDLVLGNIIVNDGVYTMVDYEWVYDFAVPVEFILYRALNLYYYLIDKEHTKDIDRMYERYGITDISVGLYKIMENNFVNYVHDMRGMASVFGQYLKPRANIIDIRALNEKVAELEQSVSLYADSVNEYESRCREYESRCREYEARFVNYINEVESWKQEYAKLQNMSVKGHIKQILKRMLKRKK
ncbi:MAG: hypothetical protein RR956_01720 [Christensenella sp.]